MPTVTLDAIDVLSVDSNEYFNECRTLVMLSKGLFSIARSLKGREQVWQQKAGEKVACHFFGIDFDGTQDNLDLIGCSFHWFGVSLCNYARLVGFVRGLSCGTFARADLEEPARFEHVKNSITACVSGVPELSDVLNWRHKVGAHFAATQPKQSRKGRTFDNVSTLDMSVIFPVTFSNGRYRVHELTLTRTNAAGTCTSEIPCWSVTEVFESLVPRFWPYIRCQNDAPQASSPGDEQKK
jgi:hypothetical protein